MFSWLPASAGATSRSPSYRLCVRTPKGKTLTLQMKDEQEKLEWLALLQHQEQSTPVTST